MIHGGKYGGNTISGLHFENRVSLKDKLNTSGKFTVEGNSVFSNNKKVAEVFQKAELYKKFLGPRGIIQKSILSKELRPDQTLFNILNNTLYVIEIKFQNTEGSVDEKLQTCAFKLAQYSKLVSPLGINVKYAYVLNDWFKSPKYKDTLNYVKSVDCEYFFNEIPFSYLGLE
jgi:hypothetical protein